MTQQEHSLLQQSLRLHQRVREFALSDSRTDARFDGIAGEIARFQLQAIPGLSRLMRLSLPQSSIELPIVPSDCFRFYRVHAFSEAETSTVFSTSGTTSGLSGQHWFRTTETYRSLCIEAGRRALLGRSDRHVVIALMPAAHEGSSLAFMAERFMEEFDGRGIAKGASFDLAEPERWLLSDSGVDVDRLGSAVASAGQTGAPVLLLTTSFALVLLLDTLGEAGLQLPPGSVVMTTGGFKGRTRTVERAELYARCRQSLGVETVVGEYGMTELSSQLYEGLVSGASLVGPEELYLEPSTLRVFPLDPNTLAPVVDGQAGLACFVDLGNVDSAVCVVTQDLVRREGTGIRLLGRQQRAPLRGCSLGAELLVSRAPMAQSPVSRSLVAASEPGAPPVEQERLARRRVRSLVDAARRLSEPGSSGQRELSRRLQTATGLSPEGIQLALARSLENQVNDDELDCLQRSVQSAPRVWVLLSANVFVAPLRAVALALASSGSVRVRPSRRDPVLTEALHAVVGDECFRIVDELSPQPGDHVHAYGSNETMDAVSEGLPAGVVLHAHGAGFGAAAVFTEANLEQAAEGIAQDIVVFDQQGCLSPRVVFVERGANITALARGLATSLAELEEQVPIGSIRSELAADVAWFSQVARYGGDVLAAGHGVVACPGMGDQPLLPPPARCITVCAVADLSEALCQLGSELTCVGIAGGVERSAELEARLGRRGVRVTRVGWMQRPPLDGPVDRRPSAAPRLIGSAE